jgi:hypothetical protein
LKQLRDHSLSYLEELSESKWSFTHQLAQVTESEKQRAVDDFSSACRILKDLLGECPEASRPGKRLTLFGRSISEENLSSGQIVLLQLGIALHAKGNSLDNCVLILNNQPQIRVLDYGAGRARLHSALEILPNSVEYFAYEPDPKNAQYCRETLGIANVFERETDIPIDKESVDVAILCNLLHEIEPHKWIDLFANREGILQKSVKSNGRILIVEDMRIPSGEKAHPLGFFLLDSNHLKTLFAVKEVDVTNKDFVFSEAKEGRLKAHLIAKKLLGRVTTESRSNCIKQVRQTAKDEIERLRKILNPTFKDGQLHALWTQQFANASIWIDHQ